MIRLLNRGDLNDWGNLISQLSPNASVHSYDYDRLNRDDKEIYVWESEGKIVGTVSLLFEQKCNRSGGICVHIEDVVVDQHYRSVGIATQLLDFALNRAKQRRAYKVVLECTQDLTALYEKVGFKTMGVSMAHYIS